MAKRQPVVAILMGSEKDGPVMAEAGRILDEFGVAHETRVISAHRTPEQCRSFARGAAKRGVKVIIAGAGKAAHLAGVVASQTTLPVIGVPLDAGMGGLDALLATVQMPRGVPVATMAVGGSGAANAALFAVAVLALTDTRLAAGLARYRVGLAKPQPKERR
ncbi:5-(carboxyamino)imidazole ribonucleotide mutase [candidate division WOR-3 bacterium]|nr:5-(carboxyamino)imidazole ribonucleotide mutase [candidate division WOR-3 bacterium]